MDYLTTNWSQKIRTNPVANSILNSRKEPGWKGWYYRDLYYAEDIPTDKLLTEEELMAKAIYDGTVDRRAYKALIGKYNQYFPASTYVKEHNIKVNWEKNKAERYRKHKEKKERERKKALEKKHKKESGKDGDGDGINEDGDAKDDEDDQKAQEAADGITLGGPSIEAAVEDEDENENENENEINYPDLSEGGIGGPQALALHQQALHELEVMKNKKKNGKKSNVDGDVDIDTVMREETDVHGIAQKQALMSKDGRVKGLREKKDTEPSNINTTQYEWVSEEEKYHRGNDGYWDNTYVDFMNIHYPKIRPDYIQGLSPLTIKPPSVFFSDI